MSTTVNLAKVRAKADEWISYAGDTIAQVNWRDLALVKLCLCALGVIIGLCVPKEKKKIVLISTLVLLVVTYIPLIIKSIRLLIEWAQCRR